MVPASAAMREVLEGLGRKRKNGTLIYCTPSVVERDTLINPRSSKKIIYDSPQVAAQAVLAIFNLTGTMMDAYVCHRSKRGHLHLTSRKSKKGKGRK